VPYTEDCELPATHVIKWKGQLGSQYVFQLRGFTAYGCAGAAESWAWEGARTYRFRHLRG
jgi:hypothetical protein